MFTKEEKDLVFADICARLPYKPRVEIEYVGDVRGTVYTESGILDPSTTYSDVLRDFLLGKIISMKTYLRKMSSMTAEERKVYNNLRKSASPWACVDWLNKNYFDYNSLLCKGLAIELTKNNNPYESLRAILF